MNLDEDGTEVNNEVKPPPKMSEMLPKIPQEPSAGIIAAQQTFLPSQHANTDPSSSFEMQQFGYNTDPSQNQPHFPGQASYGANNPAAPANVPTVGEEVSKPSQPNMFKLQRGRSK